VQAFAGDQQATIAWNWSRLATSYSVKRATTQGGPYERVGLALGTNFTDAKLANDTTYYYVVSARNSGGETFDSGEVSVTPVAASP
jgi:fibronectin type 3 domain-containing protein